MFPKLLFGALVIIFGSRSVFADSYCPSLCTCKTFRSSEVISTNKTDVDWYKLKCGSPLSPIAELKEIDFGEISPFVVNINVSGNAFSTLTRILNLPQLKKLDLSFNQISHIESDTFYNVSGLQRLELSGNFIHTIYKEIFKGLVNLERLFLSQNKIATLSSDTFDHLIELKQIDISGNPLKCDCDLLWIANWSRRRNVKLIGNPKCGQPEKFSNQSIKNLSNIKCSSPDVVQHNNLVLKPENGQLVFEGDSLTLSCKAPFTTIKTIYNLNWTLPETAVDTEKLKITNIDVLEDGLAESVLTIEQISSNHSGQYKCVYSKDNATDLTEQINVVVISNLTKYCPVTVSSNNKGVYTWPGSITGHRVSQPCYNKDGALAFYTCGQDGAWAQLNTTACPYISETTKLLEQMALVNLTVYKGTASAAGQHLLSLVKQHPHLSDPDDINFIARALHNYVTHLPTEKELGSILLDVVNTMMDLPQAVLRVAENLYNACTSTVKAVEDISQFASNIQGHKMNLAVERFAIKRESFTGMTCVWYSSPDLSVEAGGRELRMLHCSTTNRTITPLLTVRDKVVQASIQIPATLLYRIDHQFSSALGGRNVHKSHGLMVSMYESAALFPRLPANSTEAPPRVRDFYGGRLAHSKGILAITTPVVGVKLVNVTLAHPLAEPVYIMVRDAGLTAGVSGRAVLWDEDTNSWTDSPQGCSVVRIISNMVVIQCYKLGYVGLMQSVETGFYGGRSGGARFKFSHPAIYAGSLILMGCLVAAILTYIVCYSGIHMPPRAKHSLINTWLALSLLCFMYTLGIYQTEDVQLCQVIGILLHYLTLCCLLWITVSVSQLYKHLTKNQNDSLHTPDDELPPEVPIQKPILGIYLVGWGIALIVCGISGAVNMRDYASYSQCFLSNAPALSAVFVPAGIIIVFLSILFLLIRCSVRNVNGQLSEGTQATENVDLEMWEPSLLVNNTADRQSEHDSSESEIEDTEHTPIVQLRAHVIVLCFYLASWTCGTIAIYHPFPLYLPYQEDIFSILYALSATVLGTFILFFYGIARSDVRSQWLLMHCYFKKRKQCCRTRSVFDANAQNVPGAQRTLAPISNIAAAQARTRPDSQSSNRTNSKSNNSNILKAAAELNGQTLNDSIPNNGKASNNMNLVVLHRQQYHSNNSVTAFPEGETDVAEVFYNANQSNVARKFFKKQRKHVRRNCLDIPKRHPYDSDSQVSGMHPATIENIDSVSSILSSSSKVNNTNIHVERGQSSDNGIKECRHQPNPNILSEQGESPDKPPLKRFVLEKERDKVNEMKQCNRSPMIMNIYTNVPETKVPQHQVVSSNDIKSIPEDIEMESCLHRSSSVSAEYLNCDALRDNLPTMRTVSQQCSLEYSSNSEVATPLNQLGSDKTLNTHSELTSLQETHSALCSTHEITSDTDDAHSFAKYADFLSHKPRRGVENSKQHTSCSKLQNETNKKSKFDSSTGMNVNRSLQDINAMSNSQQMNDREYDEALTPCNDRFLVNENIHASESDNLMLSGDDTNTTLNETKINNHLKNREGYFQVGRPGKREFETSSAIAGEHTFENGSDIYFPNYQVSEVSIQSHGLYAPAPTSICANDLDLTFSNGELSRNQPEDDCYENQYVNYNPAWRKVKEDMDGSHSRFYHSPAVSCPDVNRLDNDSPFTVSLVSELDELYKQITSKDRLSKKPGNSKSNENALRHCESDSCISESHSDILQPEHSGETRV